MAVTRTDMFGEQSYEAVKMRLDAQEATKTPKQRCQEQGGFWDEKTQTCLMAPIAQKTETKAETSKQPTDAGFAPYSHKGVNYPRTAQGRSDYIAAGGVGDVIRAGEGRPSKEQELQQQALAQQQTQALQGLGLTPQQIIQAQAMGTEAPINFGQAATAGAAQAIPGIAAGAIGGATVGALGGPIGAVGGAIIGGVGAFLNGIRSNIKSQQGGEIDSTKKTLTAAKTNMRQLAILADKDPGNAAQYVDAYNQQLANVYVAQAKLKRETSGNLNKFMDDGTSDLTEFELFLQPGGLADIYEQRLAMALVGGVPLEFSEEDLMMYEGQ